MRFAAALALAGCAAFAPQQAPARDLAALQADLERVAQAAGGTVGVAVRHIESGEELVLNRGARIPMGSVFKVPVAVQLLTLVEQSALSLDKTLPILDSDLRAGSGNLAKNANRPASMTVRELLEIMLIDSDNTATDLLWKEAGGAPAVNARLAALDVKGILVARPTGELIADARARKLLSKEGRDTTTPEAFLALLEKIWRGEALAPPQTQLLLGIMHRCATGRGRLPAGLPRGTPVARKTGTLQGYVTNDAGIVTLPGNAGHVAIVVLVDKSPQDLKAQERVIADIARAVYGHFTQ